MQKFFLIFFLTLSFITTYSQKKWETQIAAGLTHNSGNVNNLNLRHNAEIKRNDSLIAASLLYNLIYSKEDSIETNKGINTGFKLDFKQYNTFSPFLVFETLSNKYKGYDLKISSIAGLKYRFFYKPDTCNYSVSLAFVYENIDYTPEEEKLDKQILRLSLRPKFKQKITDFITLTHITFYQPNIKNFGDYIINSKTQAENKLTKKLFLDFTFSIEYNSKVPDENYKHTDTYTIVTLKLIL